MSAGEGRSRSSANISRVLWDSAEGFESRLAVVELDSGRQFTYGELLDRVARVAGGLSARGLQPGDRVALLMRNSVAYVEAFLGAAAAGLVVVPLNVRLTNDDFRHMLADSEAAAIVLDPEFQTRLEATGDLDQLLVVSTSSDCSPGKVLLDELANGGERLEVPVHRDGQDLCSLMYTSGTTGDPKAVMLPNRAWRTVGEVAATVLGFDADEAVLHPAPLTHGAGFLLLPTLAVGGMNLVCRSFDPAAVAAALAEGRVTSLFMVPSMIRLLLDALPESWSPSARLRCLYYAGSPIDPSTLAEAVDRLGGRLVQSFAQMESPMFFSVLDQADHRRAVSGADPRLVHSAGRVLPDVRLRIVDLDGAGLPVGAAGEIVAEAPQTMLGYWNRPAETSRTLRGGWLHTGDVGYLDEDGYLYVVDRVKDMIVTGGSNVYAREVEEALIDVPGVREAAVIGVAHRIWGEAVAAVLVPEGVPLPDAEVTAACRARLADYKVPKSIVWRDELPRNAYGKVLKRELRTSVGTALNSPPAG